MLLVVWSEMVASPSDELRSLPCNGTVRAHRWLEMPSGNGIMQPTTGAERVLHVANEANEGVTSIIGRGCDMVSYLTALPSWIANIYRQKRTLDSSRRWNTCQFKARLQMPPAGRDSLEQASSPRLYHAASGSDEDNQVI